MPFLSMKRLPWVLAGLLLLLVVGRDFMVATTFLGDDYLFRAFGQIEHNPFVAFASDKHGGEYYRPVPMLVWWLLERLGGGRLWPFATTAFLLHCACAALLALVAKRLGASRRTAMVACALFFAAPAQREAALWFSASTDLLSAAAMLGALFCFLSPGRTRRGASLALAAVAFLSKETALVLPLLIGLVCWYRRASPDRQGRAVFREMATAIVPFCALAAAYVLIRCLVLHGIGGNNDPGAPVWAVGLQIFAGCAHAVSAYTPLPDWAALLVGGVALGAAGMVLRRSRLALLAALWAIVAVLPLPAAGWLVGARYFYFAGAGLMLLVALALERTRPWLSAVVVLALLGLGTVASNRRAADVGLYREAVTAARNAVSDGLAKGARVFLVRGSVKDLDLALKLDPASPPSVRDALVIPDVPASFVWLPRGEAERFAFLLADPPLPPSGAYRFGAERIVGLARRQEAPDLDEVLTRLPDLRIIRLALDARPVSWLDTTAAYSPQP
jgi:hypothetical protein